MTNLDDEARVILDLARDTHDPNDQDRARVRTALASQLGAAAGLGLAVGVGVGASAKAAAATSAGATAKALGAGTTAAKALGAGTAAAKLIGAVVLVSATVGVGATAIHHARHTAVAPVAMAQRTTTHRDQHRLPVAAPVTSPGVAIPTGTLDEEEASPPPSAPPPTVAPAERPALAETTERVRATAMANGPRHSAPLVAATQALGEDKGSGTESREPRALPAVADEVRLVHAALVAVRSGQRERALELFDEHAFRYPRGALAEERDAKRALVLADLGRTADARTAINHFLRTYPVSPLAARLHERLRDLDRP